MKSYLSKKLVGTWRFISWTYQDAAGTTLPYFGEDATGILQYDESGYMSVQLMRGQRKPFVSQALDGSTQQEAYEAYASYIAYYGRYHEDTPGEITHLVEGSLFPNWVGQKQVRYGELVDDTLILKTPAIPVGDSSIVFRLTWRAIDHAITKSSSKKDRKIGNVF